MKKFLFTVAICVLTVLALTGCATPETDVLLDSVSYAEKQLYHGEFEGFAVEITVGDTEEPRTNDGKVNELKPFVKISVIPLNAGVTIDTLTYSFGGTEGALERSPARYEYAATIHTDTVSTEIKLTLNGEENTVSLTDVTAGYIDWKEAVKLAGNEFSAIIEKETAEGVFMRETQVRIMRNTLGGKPFYYYVAMVKPDDDFPSAAALIDPTTQKVVAKRT